MIHVIAIITTKPGKLAEVLPEFKAIVPVVHTETGCIEYQPVVDVSESAAVQDGIGADTFIVVEKWETLADLQAHSVSAHMKAYAEKVGSLIADRKIHILENA